MNENYKIIGEETIDGVKYVYVTKKPSKKSSAKGKHAKRRKSRGIIGFLKGAWASANEKFENSSTLTRTLATCAISGAVACGIGAAAKGAVALGKGIKEGWNKDVTALPSAEGAPIECDPVIM